MNNFIRQCTPTAVASISAVVSTIYWANPSNLPQENQIKYRTKCDKPQPRQQKQETITTSQPKQIEQTTPKRPASDNNTTAKLLFLGTGSSTGCPKPLCSLLFPPGKDGISSSSLSSEPELDELRKMSEKACRTSRLASQGDPRHNKNYRGNPSLVISHFNNDDQEDNIYHNASSIRRNIIIDVGKTFRENAIRFLPSNNIYHLDAIVLTHEHMDAMGGLDDVRGIQLPQQINHHHNTLPMYVPRKPIPVYLSSQCFKAIQNQFFYLVPRAPKEGEVKRAVASLEYNTIHHFQPFVAGGLKMIPLPIMHGEDFVSNGYAFTIRNRYSDDEKGREEMNVLYLSDISRMLPETEEYILQNLPPTDVLVLDSLNMERHCPVHFSLNEALELVKRLKPKRTFIVGINCDDFLPHDEMNEKLSKLDMDVQLAYDGLVLHV